MHVLMNEGTTSFTVWLHFDLDQKYNRRKHSHKIDLVVNLRRFYKNVKRWLVEENLIARPQTAALLRWRHHPRHPGCLTLLAS